MCGIAGTNSPDYDLDNALSNMTRGNDEERIFANDDVRFGFQRHAIVSPEQTSTQPYFSGGQIFAANGELFNFNEIRSRLKNGADLSADCTDIEILHRYVLENGVNAVSSLNMMVAAAVYNVGEQTLYLFRDWVGEMPLHYCYDSENGRWFFGSTIASVVQATKQKAAMVQEVPPGNIVTISPNGVSTQPYFDIQETDVLHDIEYGDAVERVHHLIDKSAQARTWTGVPVCSLVSGGIDSLITTHLLLKHGGFSRPLPVYTFHCSDFDIDVSTDLFHAKRVVEWFGDKVEHRIVTTTKAEIINRIPTVVNALEDVRGKDYNVLTGLYNQLLAERISQDGMKLVFEGEGPDEALGSYSAWGSEFTFTDQEIGDPRFRKKMVSNLYKGVLLRTSKIMMNAGPLECRSFFLDRDVMTFLSSLPAHLVRSGGRKKGILIDAFKDEIPEDLLVRPKARPQDSTGITQTIYEFAALQGMDFKAMLNEHFEQLRAGK